jgi:hypothetical protein
MDTLVIFCQRGATFIPGGPMDAVSIFFQGEGEQKIWSENISAGI